MSSWLRLTVLVLVAAGVINAMTDHLQTEGDKVLGDRIDLVNARVDRECGR